MKSRIKSIKPAKVLNVEWHLDIPRTYVRYPSILACVERETTTFSRVSSADSAGTAWTICSTTPTEIDPEAQLPEIVKSVNEQVDRLRATSADAILDLRFGGLSLYEILGQIKMTMNRREKISVLYAENEIPGLYAWFGTKSDDKTFIAIQETLMGVQLPKDVLPVAFQVGDDYSPSARERLGLKPLEAYLEMLERGITGSSQP
jgi:hypothetical protein